MPGEERERRIGIFFGRLLVFFVYFFSGGAIFMLIEKGDANYSHYNKTAIIKEIGQNVMNKYNMSPDQFENLTQEIFNINSEKPNAPWTYYEGLTYVLHLLTTIGYGTITPKTEEGQIVTIFYGLFGIPLTLLVLKAMGCYYNGIISKAIAAIETKCLKRNHVKKMEIKVVFCNLFVTLIYLLLSALTSTSTDKYKYGQSVYVWFITMTTVGFGDFVPKEAENSSSIYKILVGLCFMSGTIDAIVSYQEKMERVKESRPNKRNCLCCWKKSSSLQIQTAIESNTNQATVEMKEEVDPEHPNDKQTQTTGIFNHCGQYDD